MAYLVSDLADDLNHLMGKQTILKASNLIIHVVYMFSQTTTVHRTTNASKVYHGW